MLSVFAEIQNLEPVTLIVAGERQENDVESGLFERHKHCLAAPRTAKNTVRELHWGESSAAASVAKCAG